MEAIKFLVLVFWLSYVSAFTENSQPVLELAAEKTVRNYGYPFESHEVKTEDDYILTVQRIPYGKNDQPSDSNRPAVLLMHGLLSSSSDWIAKGPQLSIAYILADLGYDVWLGNARGNAWSRKHMYLDPDYEKEKFWDFSWHEIGYYDLPAKIDYIIEKTGQEKIFYVGHSQGCTSFFVMATTRPEYNKKIRLSTMLAPPAYMSNINNKLLQLLSEFNKSIAVLAKLIGLYEFLPYKDLYTQMGQKDCLAKAKFPELCSNIYFLTMGYDTELLDESSISVVLKNFPAGAAIKQLAHYGQSIKKGKFRQFDHGYIKNLAKYGSLTPPNYNLKNIVAPVALYYSVNDNLVAIKDVGRLAEELPNLANRYLVPYEKFTHFDFLLAEDVVRLLYNEVIKTMKKY